MYQSYKNLDIGAVGDGNKALSLTPYYRPPGSSRVDVEIDLDVIRVIRDPLPIISSVLIFSHWNCAVMVVLRLAAFWKHLILWFPFCPSIL